MRTCLLTVALGWVLLALGCALGCGGKSAERFIQVSGRVTVGGKPLATGQIGFIPDEARGTMHPEYSIGNVQADGAYTLATNDKGGVRPGWYKVVVWASAEPLPAAPVYEANGELKPVCWLVATKYTKKETTDLQIEVVDHPPPGAYDLNLSPP